MSRRRRWRRGATTEVLLLLEGEDPAGESGGERMRSGKVSGRVKYWREGGGGVLRKMQTVPDRFLAWHPAEEKRASLPQAT